MPYTHPTASQSPDGQYPSENICELKSCCCNCLPSRRSQDRTVLSNPPVVRTEILVREDIVDEVDVINVENQDDDDVD